MWLISQRVIDVDRRLWYNYLSGSDEDEPSHQPTRARNQHTTLERVKIGEAKKRDRKTNGQLILQITPIIRIVRIALLFLVLVFISIIAFLKEKQSLAKCYAFWADVKVGIQILAPINQVMLIRITQPAKSNHNAFWITKIKSNVASFCSMEPIYQFT